MKNWFTRKRGTLQAGILLLLFLLGGCAGIPTKDKSFPDFVAVIPGDRETLSTLATKYLKDPSKGWVIGDFNGITEVKPGQQLIIPLTPPPPGGITPRGYQTVPVLCYHNFSVNESNKMTVTRDNFEAQMRFLKEKGYTVISLNQLFDFIQYRAPIPRKSVVITIDDGWRSTMDIAFPILKKYGYPATLFICTDMIRNAKGNTLNWEQVKQLKNGGMDIQFHTATHCNLTDGEGEVSAKEQFSKLQDELACSKEYERFGLKKDMRFLAYPYGDTGSLVIAFLEKMDFEGAFTVKRGSNPFFANPYRIGRSAIYGEYDLKKFEKNLVTFSNKAMR